MSLTELKKGLKEGKIVIGTEMTEKFVKSGKVKEIFMASNASDILIKKFESYSKIFGFKLNKLEENGKDLGAVCKKPFSITVCCYLK